MYMTRFPVNRTRRKTIEMLASPYKMHAAIAGSFSPNSKPGRVLWRIDTLHDNKTYLYIVSSSVPSLTGLDEQIGWPDLSQQWQTRDYDTFIASIEEGGLYRFRLVANPVISRAAIKTDTGASKRLSHLTSFQQAAWLIGKEAYAGTELTVPATFLQQSSNRAERNGFSVICDSALGVPELVVSNRRRLSFKQGNTGRTITLVTVCYDGVLRVIDADAMRSAMVCGIGHAKGFGCGLLTLEPVK